MSAAVAMLVVGAAVLAACSPAPVTERSAGPPGPVPATPSPAPSLTAAPPASGPMLSLDERVAFWEARVAASATDYSSTLALIDAYLARARRTGDLGDLERARTALERARRLAPTGDVGLPLREGQVAFSLHDFAAARSAAETALALDPGHEAGVALLADAALELGDDDAAAAAYALLEAEPPSPPILVRLARHDLLRGDVERAETRLRAAVEAATAEAIPGEAAAYCTQLAELLRGQGRIEEAAAWYEAALADDPESVPALGGLARVREAEGRRAEAIELLEQATTRMPTPELVAELGDLHALAGDEAAARDAHALVERIAEVARATGAVYDRQLVLFLADHDLRADEAVALAEAEIAARQDVYTFDALAWALYRAGRLDEAADAVRQAMRLGTLDGRILYHAGLIAIARGEADEARELLAAAAERSAALPALQVEALHEALDGLEG